MKCSVDNCDVSAKYKGLCGMHYKRQWRHGDPAITLTPTRGFERTQCTAQDCELQSVYSCGLCEKHYVMQRLYGRTHNITNRGSGYTINGAGYIMLWLNGKWVYEHIHRAQKALGKPLPKGAVVHHMNQIPHDNDTPFNLIVCPSQTYHLLLHRRMKEFGYASN